MKITADKKEYRKAYYRHMDTCRKLDDKNKYSRRLLLFYSVECGLKYLLMDRWGILSVGEIDGEQESVFLEWNHEKLLVDFTGEEPEKNDKHIPLFRKILYKDFAYGSEAEKKPLLDIPVTVFHSYKGGVGRTLSLLAFAKAWSEKQPVPV